MPGNRLRALLHEIGLAAIQAVMPEVCMPKALLLADASLSVQGVELPLTGRGRLLVAGMGKAAAGMAATLEQILGCRISEGLVVVPDGHFVSTRTVEVVTAGHPIPDERSIHAARRIAGIADAATSDDLVILLVSGGGSALATLPADPLSLGNVLCTTDLLLHSGADIHEVNSIRKHLSQLKGGHFARRAYPASILSVIISDVPFDTAESVSSGPTAPDSTSFSSARSVLKRYGLWRRIPSAVRMHIQNGVRGRIPETPKAGDVVFERVHNVIVASGRTAVEAAAAAARRLECDVEIARHPIVGDAGSVGASLAKKARLMRGGWSSRPKLFVAAGETTVRLRSPGRGGRNQNVALAAGLDIDGMCDAVVGSLATDGVDGPTDAAGAIVDGGSAGRIRASGLDPERLLADNDAYPALRASGDLIEIGPTGTNVSDLFLVLVGQ